MTTRERAAAVFSGRMPDDRLPVLEWAMWWDKTVEGWEAEGMPKGLSGSGIADYFGLDRNYQFWLRHSTPQMPKPASHGAPRLTTPEEYRSYLAKGWLLPDPIDPIEDSLREAARMQKEGELIWFTFDGFFWWPRTLLGIEPHLYSFYDQPEFYHEMCRDLAEWQIRAVEKMSKIIEPDFMTFAEDMSYNLGPMISRDIFDEFMKPYYLRVTPVLKKHHIRVIVDSDGDISSAVPWFISAGAEGILPLERQAGVDIPSLSLKYPEFIWLGGFDKMTMFRGKEAMRAEFERLLPAMKRGRFIASVDHQTPPGVSLQNYRDYVELHMEYAERAVRER